MTPPQRKSLLHVTGLLMASRGAGWALGFIREMTIAALFGASRIVDAFAIANILPNAVYSMLGGVLASSLIPHFVAVKASHGEAAARQTVRAIMMQLALLTLCFAVVVMIFAPYFIHWFAPTFSPEDSQRAIRFLRILIVGIIGASVFLVLQNVYQIHDKWTLPALGPLFANSIAIGILIIGSSLIGSDALAWSWLFAFLILPFILLLGKTGRVYVGLQLRDPNTKAFYVIAVPVFLASVLGTVIMIVDRHLASGLPAGELSSLAYAHKVYLMCGDLVMATIIPALFPRLAESAVIESKAEYANLLEKALLGVTLVTICGAATLGGLVLPLVEVMFERGAFAAADTIRVARILFAFSGTLVFFVPLLVVYRAFFAARKSYIPTIAMFIGTCIDITLCFQLIGPLGTPGLAVSTMIGLGSQLILLLIYSHYFGVLLPSRKMMWLFLRGIFAGLIVAGILHWLDSELRMRWETHLIWMRLIRLIGLMILSGVLFTALAKLLRLPGFDLLETYAKGVWRRVRSSESPPSVSA